MWLCPTDQTKDGSRVRLVFALIFIFVSRAQSEALSWDWVSVAARSRAYVATAWGNGRNCPQSACNATFSGNPNKPLVECRDLAMATEMWKEVAPEQKAELQCEFDYLGKYDLDPRSSCDNFRASSDLKKNIEFALQERRLANKPEVFTLQSYAVNRMLNDAEQICLANKSGDKITAAAIPAGTWNASNGLVQDYLSWMVKEGGPDCSQMAEGGKARERIRTMALNPRSAKSFQQRIIDQGRKVSCETMDFLNEVSADPSSMTSKDFFGRFRDFRSYLTGAALLKMKSDPEFSGKYGFMQCQLEVEYGSYAQNVEVTGKVSAFAVSLLGPMLIRLGGRLALARLAPAVETGQTLALARDVEILASTLSATTLSLDLYMGLVSDCSTGAPEYTRQNICANKGMRDLPLDALVQTEFNQNAVSYCLIGTATALASVGNLTKSITELRKIRGKGLSPTDLQKRYKMFKLGGKEKNLYFLEARETHSGSVRHVVIDNIVLAEINERALKSKAQGTAVTNLYKTGIVEGIHADHILRDPNNTIAAYDDWKGMEIMLDDDPKVVAQMNEVYSDLQMQYGNMFNHPDYQRMLNDPELRGMVKDPSNWFRAGKGPTSAKANFAARASRVMEGSTYEIIDYYDPRVQEKLTTGFDNLKSGIKKISSPSYNDWVEKGLLTTSKDGNVPSIGLSSIFRRQMKSSRDMDAVKIEIARDIEMQFKVKPSQEEVETIFGLFQNANSFMGKVYVPERSTWSLNEARLGFILSDREGFDARNMNALFSELSHSRTPDEAVERSSNAIDNVTDYLKTENKALQSFQQNNQSQFVPIKFTGDESILLPNPTTGRAVTVDHLRQYMRDTPVGVRAVAVSPQNTHSKPFDTRNFDALTVQAEEFQKQLSRQLSQSIGFAESSKIKLGAYITPAGNFDPQKPLGGSEFVLAYNTKDRISARAASEVQRISEELAKKFGLGNFTISGF